MAELTSSVALLLIDRVWWPYCFLPRISRTVINELRCFLCYFLAILLFLYYFVARFPHAIVCNVIYKIQFSVADLKRYEERMRVSMHFFFKFRGFYYVEIFKSVSSESRNSSEYLMVDFAESKQVPFYSIGYL